MKKLLPKIILLLSLAATACCSRVMESKSYATTIDGKEYSLTTTDYLLSNNPKDSFNINGTSYTAGPVWGILRLDESAVHEHTTYRVWGMSLGRAKPDIYYCSESSILYKQHTYNPSFLVQLGFSDPTDCGWCFWVEPDSKFNYKSYTLRVTDVVMYSNYLGTHSDRKIHDFTSLGDYTMSTAFRDQNFTHNGIITSWSLSNREMANLRFDGRIKHIETLDSLLKLTSTPEWEYDVNSANCSVEHEGYNLPFPVKEKIIHIKNDLGFTYYQALRPGVKEYTDLRDPFLSVYAVMHYADNNWVFDPCLSLFYMISYSFPYWFIDYRGKWTPATESNCIIIQDTNDKDDLGVYTYTKDSMRLVPSNKFSGILSRDLISQVTSKITSQWTPILELHQAMITPAFLSDTELLLVSLSPEKCLVYLSQNHSEEVDFSVNLIFKVDYSKWVPLATRIFYSCGIATGWFDPPANVSMLASHETYTFEPLNQTYAGSNYPAKTQSTFTLFVRKVLRTLTLLWDSLFWWLRYLIVFIMFLACLRCISRKKEGRTVNVTLMSNELVPLGTTHITKEAYSSRP